MQSSELSGRKKTTLLSKGYINNERVYGPEKHIFLASRTGTLYPSGLPVFIRDFIGKVLIVQDFVSVDWRRRFIFCHDVSLGKFMLFKL